MVTGPFTFPMTTTATCESQTLPGSQLRRRFQDFCSPSRSLRYRCSTRGLALDPTAYQWASSLFTTTLSYLPGLPSDHRHFSYVTYPRLGNLNEDSLFLSLRDGKAGHGADHLYRYRASTGLWTFVGTPLTGVDSNPYVHGWDVRDGVLHVTWVYRGFVWYEGWDDAADTKHKQQAGPNGAENNHQYVGRRAAPVCLTFFLSFSCPHGRAWRDDAR